MDFQLSKQSALLSFRNGKSLTSQTELNKENDSVTNQVLYYFELEQDQACINDFLAIKEINFPNATNISTCLVNFDFPNGDLIEIEKLDKHLTYYLYTTISREHWLYKTSLYTFVPEFIYALNKFHLSTTLLLEEEFGCYLKTQLQVPATQKVYSRVKTISRKMANIQQNVLVSLNS